MGIFAASPASLAKRLFRICREQAITGLTFLLLSMAVKPDAAMGYRTGAKFLLIFMFAFFLLGYSYILSIALGAIAGLSSGFMAAWWNAREDFFTEEETAKAERSQADDESSGRSFQPRALRYGFGVKLAKTSRADRQQQQNGFSWWFLRRKR